MDPHSLAALCVLLFVDGATFSFATTPLLLEYGKHHPAWIVATVGGAASALGSGVQLALLRLAIGSERPWMRRFAPSSARVRETLARYPSTSFLAILIARATPLPDAPIKLVAAAIGYSIALYVLAVYLGALPYYFALAALGRAVRIPTAWLAAAAGAFVLVLVAERVVRARRRRA